MSVSLLFDRRQAWASKILSIQAIPDQGGTLLVKTTDVSCLEYQLVLVCPSALKECGIGRYTNHVEKASLKNFHSTFTFQSTYQALNHLIANPRPAIVIFQHEYSLVDFQFDLGEDDTTASVITNLSLIQGLNQEHRTCVLMHSVLLLDHGLNRINRQWHSAQLPLFHTSREGCALAQLNFTDLGIPGFGFSQPPPLPASFTIGAFGFLSPNKDVSSTLRLCAATGARIRANYAPSNSESDSAIRAEKAKVEKLFTELDLTGKVTFDFLEDDELVEMLRETSIIYAPQHDFAHYSTSASVRFPLAVGRGVIVPPHRCFHDAAAGVKFADFDTAVSTVRSMMSMPDQVRELGKAGFAFAEANEIGLVYKKLAEKLIAGDVWCGGDVRELRLPSALPAVKERVDTLADETCWSHQNAAGRLNTGRGLRGGFFLYDLASAQSISNLEEVIAGKSKECDSAFRDGTATEWIQKELLDKPLASALFRAAFGGNPNRISLLEIEEAPIYLQVLCLTLKLNMTAHGAAQVLAAIGVGHERMQRLASVFTLAELLSYYSEENAAATEDLVWGHAMAPYIDQMREIVYPASLLTLQPSVFVKSIYRLLLKREPDDGGLIHNDQLLKSGMKWSDFVFGVSNSTEGRMAGVRLAGTHERWSDFELEAQNLCEMSKLVAPFRGLLKTDNLELRDRVYAGLLR